MAMTMLFVRKKGGNCGPLISSVVGTYVAFGLILATACVLLIPLLMSPESLRDILKQRLQLKCENFPESDSPNSSAAENVEHDVDGFMRMVAHDAAVSGTINDSSTTLFGKTTVQIDKQEFESPSLQDANSGTEAALPVIRILIGIFTMSWNVDRRHLLRLAYGTQWSDDAEISVMFVLGAYANDGYRTLMEKENATYGDIMVLDCPENMDDGKTFTFFSSLTTDTSAMEYDYVMKTDDDSYVRLANLATHLKLLPRTDLYYGYNLPCGSEDAYGAWMAGAGYLMSWDLVVWIRESPIPRNNTVGTEDKLVAQWFNEGGVARNRAVSNGLFIDHVDYGGACAHEVNSNSILVHKLKTLKQWHQVLAFFKPKRRNSVSP